MKQIYCEQWPILIMSVLALQLTCCDSNWKNRGHCFNIFLIMNDSDFSEWFLIFCYLILVWSLVSKYRPQFLQNVTHVAPLPGGRPGWVRPVVINSQPCASAVRERVSAEQMPREHKRSGFPGLRRFEISVELFAGRCSEISSVSCRIPTYPAWLLTPVCASVSFTRLRTRAWTYPTHNKIMQE